MTTYLIALWAWVWEWTAGATDPRPDAAAALRLLETLVGTARAALCLGEQASARRALDPGYQLDRDDRPHRAEASALYAYLCDNAPAAWPRVSPAAGWEGLDVVAAMLDDLAGVPRDAIGEALGPSPRWVLVGGDPRLCAQLASDVELQRLKPDRSGFFPWGQSRTRRSPWTKSMGLCLPPEHTAALLAWDSLPEVGAAKAKALVARWGDDIPRALQELFVATDLDSDLRRVRTILLSMDMSEDERRDFAGIPAEQIAAWQQARACAAVARAYAVQILHGADCHPTPDPRSLWAPAPPARQVSPDHYGSDRDPPEDLDALFEEPTGSATVGGRAVTWTREQHGARPREDRSDETTRTDPEPRGHRGSPGGAGVPTARRDAVREPMEAAQDAAVVQARGAAGPLPGREASVEAAGAAVGPRGERRPVTASTTTATAPTRQETRQMDDNDRFHDEPDTRTAAPLARREPDRAPMQRYEERPVERDEPPIPVPRESARTDIIRVQLARAQMEFPFITKTRHADAGTKGTYSFANLGDVARETFPILFKHGIVASWRIAGDRMYLQLCHAESGQWLESDLQIVPPDRRAGVQQLGSALSYVRRYLLVLALGIILLDEDDDGAMVSLPDKLVRFLLACVDGEPASDKDQRPLGRGDLEAALKRNREGKSTSVAALRLFDERASMRRTKPAQEGAAA